MFFFHIIKYSRSAIVAVSQEALDVTEHIAQ